MDGLIKAKAVDEPPCAVPVKVEAACDAEIDAADGDGTANAPPPVLAEPLTLFAF